MAAVDKIRRKKVKDLPRVPIQTYKWEDVRRDRRKGGYPWTYLDKSPFDDDIDTEEYTMEAMRRSKSSSTLGKPDTLCVREVTNDGRSDTEEGHYTIETSSENIKVDEDDKSEVSIVELDDSSADDNISQYLDKDDVIPEKTEDVSSSTEQPVIKITESAPAKSTSKNKRKLSGDSGYSKKSLTKIDLIEKFRHAKDKLKVPSKKQKVGKKLEVQKTVSKHEVTKTKTQEPEYIYIPLNPPPEEIKKLQEIEKDATQPKESEEREEITEEKETLSKEEEGELKMNLDESNDKNNEELNKAEGDQKKIDGLDVGKPQGSVAEVTKIPFALKQAGPSKWKERLEKIKQKEQLMDIAERSERAKSEEPARKRKLSVGSTASHKSLSKLSLFDKLKAAKDKIKIPFTKVARSDSKSLKKVYSTKRTEEVKPVKPKVEEKKTSPVYIHIPLKLPPGVTDEYSLYEGQEIVKSEQPKEEKSEENNEIDKPADEQPMSYKDIVEKETFTQVLDPPKNDLLANLENMDVKVIEEIVIVMPDNSNNSGVKIQELPPDEPQNREVENKENIVPKKTVAGPSWNRLKQRLEKLAVEEPPISDRQERAKSEEPKLKRKGSVGSSYSRKSLSRLAYMEKKFKDATNKIKFPKLPFSKSETRESKKSKKGKSEKNETKKAESAKESKKTKEETKKPVEPLYIHIPLKGPLDEPGETIKMEFDENENSKADEASVATQESPPPSDKNDVHLIILTAPSDDETLDTTVPDTPSSESSTTFFETNRIEELKALAKNVADKMYPNTQKLETVAEENRSINEDTEAEAKVPEECPKSDEEIKKIQDEVITEVIEAKEQIVPDKPKGPEVKPKKSKLKKSDPEEPIVQNEPKKEEIKCDENIPKEEKLSEAPAEPTEVQRYLVDEEDGLKLSEAAIAMINEELAKESLPQLSPEKELKSSLKVDGSPPPMKKKVSFKRKSKTENGESIYEDVQVSQKPEDQAKPVKLLDPSQSVSVEEEKPYLDDKIVKSTSLEEDYNKWSKSNDHEYEPINPPPDEVTAPVMVQHTDSQPQEVSQASSTTSLDRRYLRIPINTELIVHGEGDIAEAAEGNQSTREMQDKLEDRYFAKTPETTDSKTSDQTSQIGSSGIESQPLKSRKKPLDKTKRNINETLRNQAGKLKTKFQGIKKPNIRLPDRPKFTTPKFTRPKFTMPKIPDKAKISFPTFSLTRKSDSKWKERQFSTESNAGDSKKKMFDFSTYPRIFDRSKKNKEPQVQEEAPPQPEFATVPRADRKKGPVGSRWAKKFKDITYVDEDSRKSKEYEEDTDVVTIPLHPDWEDSTERQIASHTRYNEDIDIDDDYERENRQIHQMRNDYPERWRHGHFSERPFPDEFDREYRVTDLDNDLPELQTPPDGSFELEAFHNNGYSNKETRSSGSSLDQQRVVLEEIDSDEFFVREKGISQDDIEVGKFLSTEIREAFRNPVNALSQMQRDSYDVDVSDQSESAHEAPPRRKPIKKPKRKKTPHVSREQIGFDQESITTEPEEYPKTAESYKTYPPARPKRKSKKDKMDKNQEVVPYQETITVDDVEMIQEQEMLPDNILSDDVPRMYENERMQGIEQPKIKVSDNDHKYESYQKNYEDDSRKIPVAPTRRHRSLKSLTASTDSINGEIAPRAEVETFRSDQEFVIPTPEPVRPTRLRSARSQSHSSQLDDDRTSRGADSLISENLVPCEEPPCVQEVCDSMGYAIIDKQKVKEPPLPPTKFPPTPPRRRRSDRSESNSETKFFTVPRSSHEGPPVRPLRNYSTLGGPVRPPRKKTNLTDEEKESDVTQYIVIEDEEPSRNLQSGEVIQKMRERPLPAPPRPPRKPKEPLDDTQDENLSQGPEEEEIEEVEVSTQTDAVPEEFLSEDILSQIIVDEEVVAPTRRKRSTDKPKAEKDGFQSNREEPVEFEHQETITHGTLIVEPLDGAKIIPMSYLKERLRNDNSSAERIVPITRDEDEDETSEIPEDFKKLKDPEIKIAEVKKEPNILSSEVELLTAQKLQVADLDVDTLRVNELQANKISVSEIDSGTLKVSEINTNSGNLIVNNVELPTHLLQKLLEHLQEQEKSSSSTGTSTMFETLKNIDEDSDVKQAKESEMTQNESPSNQPNKKLVLEEQSSETSCLTKVPLEEENESTSVKGDDEAGQKKTSSAEDVAEMIDVVPPSSPRRLSNPEMEIISEALGNVLRRTLTNETIPETEKLTQVLTELVQDSQTEEPEIIPQGYDLPVSESMSRMLSDILQDTSQFDPELLDEVVFIPQTDNISRVLNEMFNDPYYGNAKIQELTEPPRRPPRQHEKSQDEQKSQQTDSPESETTPKSEDEPPPRPPHPVMADAGYLPSQPPPSFFALRSGRFPDYFEDDIPLPPRRKRHPRAPVSKSSSDEAPPVSRRHHRSPEPSIPQLTGQLARACVSAGDGAIKRLISYVATNVLQNSDGKQDLHVIIVILLVLIAGLILLGFGEHAAIHHHHWEFFNPPKSL